MEPHEGLATRFMGRDWERNDGAVNWVFRWDARLLEQTVRDFCRSIVRIDQYGKPTRVWFGWHKNFPLKSGG